MKIIDVEPFYFSSPAEYHWHTHTSITRQQLGLVFTLEDGQRYVVRAESMAPGSGDIIVTSDEKKGISERTGV